MPLLARLLLCEIFVTSAYSKLFGWESNVSYLASKHITNPALVDIMLVGALLIEGLGALCLITGFQARIAGLIMFIYMIGVGVIFHNFWALEGMARATNWMHFQKNMGIMGGLLMVAAFGPGRYSLGAGKT